ncbi:hypothetical protein LCGC14_2250060, partial [marine sediment metagenome]
TMAMLGIKNKIKETVKKVRAKILSKAASNDNKIAKLSEKYNKCLWAGKAQTKKLDDLTVTDGEWTL